MRIATSLRVHMPSRFRLISGLLVLLVATTRVFAASATFDLDDVAERARRLAAAPFSEPKGEVPDWLLEATYDQWRDIRFRPESALWRERKLPFQVQFFHPGLFYNRVVRIHVIDGTQATRAEFAPGQFDYGKTEFASRVPQKLGYAGFRVHHPLKTPAYFDELIVFLGASYFRALGRNEAFGLSARGLAVDTAESRGEEFPYFREFWLVTPTPKATELTLYALLDSPRVTGAYRFVVKPGEATVVQVETRLFLRDRIQKLGIAPLTSMFFHGENTGRWFDDFRPEVHDSDGLLLHYANGEWLWRPLDNPRALDVSDLHMQNPKGFGLIQRDRDFDHYQDLETRAEHRPSVWIEPRGDWGDGHVELVEIPTTNDSNDNVVAYWVPAKAPVPGEPATFAYTMWWYGNDADRPPGGRVLATRRDRGTAEGGHRFVIDFAGKQLTALPPEQVLRGVVTAVGGDEVADLLDQQVVKNVATGSWRFTFQVRPKTKAPIELRAFLDKADQTLTETWSYVMLP